MGWKMMRENKGIIESLEEILSEIKNLDDNNLKYSEYMLYLKVLNRLRKKVPSLEKTYYTYLFSYNEIFRGGKDEKNK